MNDGVREGGRDGIYILYSRKKERVRESEIN